MPSVATEIKNTLFPNLTFYLKGKMDEKRLRTIRRELQKIRENAQANLLLAERIEYHLSNHQHQQNNLEL